MKNSLTIFTLHHYLILFLIVNKTETSETADIRCKDTISIKEAFRIQREMCKRVVRKNSYDRIRTVAGADLAILKRQKKLLCGIIVFSYPDMKAIEKTYSVADEKFPYVPGLLAFREAPAIIETFKKLRNIPDVIMIDGQGLAHPRSFGIACHVGVFLDVPAVGVAKKRLFGQYTEPERSKGSWSQLKNKKNSEVIGAAVRTKNNVKPVFVSIGNKIDLGSAVKLTLDCSAGYRIPEPTRQADKFVSELKKMDAL